MRHELDQPSVKIKKLAHVLKMMKHAVSDNIRNNFPDCNILCECDLK